MSVEGNALELYRMQTAAYDRYVALLTAISGACIAFAVQKSEAAVIGVQLLIWAAAVLFWASSFYYGCANMRAVQEALRANFELLAIPDDESTRRPGYLEHIEKRLKANQKRTQCYYKWQFRLLALGAVLFIGWHVSRLPVQLPQNPNAPVVRAAKGP